MNNYKFNLGQKVSFVYRGEIKQGIIVRRWWYDCQGFVGFPMYDIDFGGPTLVTGMDEDKVTKLASNSKVKMSKKGVAALRKVLAEKKVAMMEARGRVKTLREEIRTLRGVLNEL